MVNWSGDAVLAGFEATTLTYDHDYEGRVHATLVRRNAPQPTTRAVLYIHGYTDYFFQMHLADAFHAHGYNFYAVDLRKYGRSLLPHQHPNFCKDVEEYFAEISDSIRIITEAEGNTALVLMGHSTGGLTSSLYAASGHYRERIDALVLNSPFFDWYLSPRLKRIIRLFGAISPAFPYYVVNSDEKPLPYMQSLYADQQGEWTMNPAWRPLNGFPIYAGWCRAINKAHARVRGGLDIHAPVLVMSSDKSTKGDEWRDEFQAADTVLNVAHIREGSQRLGRRVRYVQIADGLHDLFLSRQTVRDKAAAELFSWLETLEWSQTPKTTTEG